MRSISLSTSLRLMASAAAAGVLSMQPLSSFAQSAPTSTPANCAAPVLDLANPAPGEMLLPGAYTIQGAALDPQAQQGSGIDQVSFFLGDRDAGGIALGQTQPSQGPRQDDFSLTVTLPSTSIGEHSFVAYAHSSLTGKETQVSLPVVLGEQPSKAGVNPATATESITTPGASPSACETSATAPATSPAPATAPLPIISVPAPAVGTSPSTGIAAAEAYAASVELQAPDSNQTRDGENNQDNQPQSESDTQ